MNDLPESPPSTEFLEPISRSPGDAIPTHRLASELGWDLPIFIEPELYKVEFARAGLTDYLIAGMLDALSKAVDKAMATATADEPAVAFKFYRKPNERARKRKPLWLKATLYKNPDYDIVWALVTHDDSCGRW